MSFYILSECDYFAERHSLAASWIHFLDIVVATQEHGVCLYGFVM